MITLDEVLLFLKENPTYFLATCEGEQPRVRPFGTICRFDHRLYFQTGHIKSVYAQVVLNPKIELCCMAADGGRWLRIAATAVRGDRLEARTAVLKEYPDLASMYAPDDGNTEVFYLQDATATFYSFTEAPKTLHF